MGELKGLNLSLALPQDQTFPESSIIRSLPAEFQYINCGVFAAAHVLLLLANEIRNPLVFWLARFGADVIAALFVPLKVSQLMCPKLPENVGLGLTRIGSGN